MSDCARVRELMDSYVHGELTVESNHDVLRHLERCDACRAELSRRERMRALLLEALEDAADTSGMQARIARAIDQDQRRWLWVTRYGSVAAALVVAAAAAIWFSRPVDAAAFDDSVDDHIICALSYPPDASYDAVRASQQLEPKYQAMVHAVAHKAGEYDLIDAHMCPYQGRNYAHMVYRGENGQMLSVFAETSDRGRLPLRHESPRKGYVTTGTATGAHQVFVVASEAARAPSSVIDELMQSAKAFVKNLER